MSPSQYDCANLLCMMVTVRCRPALPHKQADFRVECGNATHTAHSVVAVIELLCFCCGLPVFTGLTLWRRFKSDRLSEARTQRRYLFLFDGYRPSRAWWESVVMAVSQCRSGVRV